MDPPLTTTNIRSPSPHTTPLTTTTQSSGPPSSLIIPISRTDIFPLPSPRTNGTILKTDGATASAHDDLALAELQQLVSFPLLPGEGIVDSCCLLDGGLLILTNYRLYVQLGEEEEYHVPLGLIESIEVKELFYLGIGCKDARSYRCTFDNNEQCLQWFGTLLKASEPPRQLQELFAFSYYAWSKENTIDDFTVRLEDCRPPVYDDAAFMKEVQRLQFGSVWRISSANEEYKMCSSYPPKLLVPSNIQDDKLEAVAKFRSSRRIPAVVWRHIGNGAVIARCSQPEVGWLGWRSSDDEDLMKEILHACAMDAMPATALDTYSHSPALSSDEDGGGGSGGGGGGGAFVFGGGLVNGTAQSGGDREDGREKGDDIGRLLNGAELKVNTEKKVLIMDARSYTTAVANRARGGGCECPEYYPSCEIQFMNLANIHSIRKSFHALRQLCTSAADQPNWFSLLEGTRWLLHQSGLMRAAVTLVTAIERDARPVLVHCSDGWDRTPQIVALAQLLLDPYYRTIDGFRILIEREWLAFGHKFADRCGHTTGSEDQNERCPVFLQWLDCVHQLLEQFPCSFEFSDIYLVKLVLHTYSNLFGTFLCNTKRDRDKELFNTFPVWTFLDTAPFRNYLYKPAPYGVQVLWPKCNVRDLKLWSAVYLGSLETTKHNTIAQHSTDNTNATPHPTTSLYQDTALAPHQHKPPPNTKRTAIPTPSTVIDDSGNKQTVAVAVVGGGVMTKTRSYGDLLSHVQCSGVNSRLRARVGGGRAVGGTDGIVQMGAVGYSDEGCKAGGGRRLSDPSTVDIKILNLAMVEHTDTTPHQGHIVPSALPTSRTLDQMGSVAALPRNVKTPQNACNQNGTAVPVHSVAAVIAVNGIARDVLDAGDINHNDRCEGVTCAVGTMPNAVASLKDSCERILKGNSVDTSTETLVADNWAVRVSPINAMDHDDTDSGRSTSICRTNDSVAPLTCTVCAQNKRFVSETHFSHQHHHHHHSQNEESPIRNNYAAAHATAATAPVNNHQPQSCVPRGQITDSAATYTLNGYYGSGSSNVTSGVNTPTSRMTDDSITAPLAPVSAMGGVGMSTSGYWGASGGRTVPGAGASLGDDGLVPLRSEMQERVATLIEENRREVERLKQELQKYRHALLQQLCHRCHHKSGDKSDDASSAAAHCANTSPTHTSHCHCTTAASATSNASAANANRSSAANGFFNCTDDGIIMGGGGGSSSCAAAGGGESTSGTAASSMRSDHSWDNVDVDDVSLLDHHLGGAAANPTLWMPDHAVSRCADCRCEFWIGRRRHHCRKCGQIFCAECSEHYAPIPTEHLYTPVRVCRVCFNTLRQSNAHLHINDIENDDEHLQIADGHIDTILNGRRAVGAFSGDTIAHAHFSPIAAQHKPSPVQPMQCCHHQHQQRTSCDGAGASVAAAAVCGGGGCGGAANGGGGGQCRRITASSN